MHSLGCQPQAKLGRTRGNPGCLPLSRIRGLALCPDTKCKSKGTQPVFRKKRLQKQVTQYGNGRRSPRAKHSRNRLTMITATSLALVDASMFNHPMA
ncbi:UNVERIFIED_CONTAM: hypothetical protein FKN15_065611 [Acipenser sinensis]